MQSSNGQVLLQTDRSTPKRHTAKHCSFADRQRIVSALANGDSIRSIARELRMSNNTVVAIREQEWQQVAARKERIAAQAELNATLAADRIADELQSGKQIPLNVLVPVFGVNVDKCLALRGDPTLTIHHKHIHAHTLNDDDVWAFMLARSKRHEEAVKGNVIAETHQLAENTRRKSRLG